MSNKEKIQKTVDALVDEALAKGVNNEAQNGGKDEIKSGSPKAEEMKLSEDADSDDQKKKKEDESDEKKDDKEMEKSDDKDADDEEEKKKKEKDEMSKKMKKAEDDKEDEEEDEKDEAKKAKKSSKMKKSIKELTDVLDEEELELIKAWRDDQAEKEETVVKSEDIAKAVSEATSGQVEDLRKALNSQNDLIKSLSDQINKLASQPAHDKRSIDTLEPLIKGGNSETTLTKALVLDVMLDLQKNGKGVNSHHVAEFESTGNISNGQIKTLVMSEAQKRS